MTIVNGWESVVVDTKISILVVLGVPDLPLYEIKMSKLKQAAYQLNTILLNILLEFI